MIALLLTSLAFAGPLTVPVRVDGVGYLRFVRDGRIVYASSANLTVAAGVLTSGGLPLTPTVRVPANAVKIDVDLNGEIFATVPSGKADCGRLVLARFEAKPTESAGFYVSATRANIGNPGEGTFGVIRSAAPAVQTAAISITVLAATEILTEPIKLSDIATIEGDAATKKALGDLIFCPRLPVGVDMPVLPYRLQGLAKQAGVVAQIHVPAGAVIRRKAQQIKEEDFVAAAVKAAQDQLGVPVALTSTDTDLSDFKAPLGAVELKSQDVTTSGNTVEVVVGIYIDGQYVNKRHVSLKPDGSAQIKAGSTVKILMKSGGITVEVTGRARTGGMLGQTITVVVTETGSVLNGIVVSKDKVKVDIS